MISTSGINSEGVGEEQQYIVPAIDEEGTPILELPDPPGRGGSKSRARETDSS